MNPADASAEDVSAKENGPTCPTSDDPASDALFAGSLKRIERFIPVLAVIATAVLAIRANWPVALGFLLGAAIAFVNFRWLKSTVVALSDAVTQTGPPRSKPSVVLRFLFRFVLIVLAAYVIFTSYPLAFHGFLGGLFVPVLAIFLEAARVAYLAIRPGG